MCLLADSVGSLLAYDALCRQPQHGSSFDTSEGEDEEAAAGGHRARSGGQLAGAGAGDRLSVATSKEAELGSSHFHFDVGHFFLLGSPLPIVLAYRQAAGQGPHPRPNCVQVYNLFHPGNPVVARLEPLLVTATHQIPPVNIPR